MLTDRFADALTFAEKLHRTQARKGNDIPYVAHLLAVTATVLEWGGDEDTAIAALLHDAVEDQGGEATAQAIRTRFGDRVADLVLHCTDSTAPNPGEKLPWLERKTAYLARLGSAGPQAALITAADKLHNLTATLRDVRRDGPQSLERFNEPDRVVWYYRAVTEALCAHRARAPIAELGDAIKELTRALASPRHDLKAVNP
ncbi:HD domain-containing protein [Phenylobacterium sp.]|uniref:HD domain-containing protein n=1 Tax=Phenylobacterium sp. TaxID=1871053 RepID=UPI003983AAF6